MGGGSETASPTPNATPATESGATLPDTGAAATLGGMAGAGTIGYASYLYLRSRRNVLDALRQK
jgi:LPXTG-motif cell wall-anchored protein